MKIKSLLLALFSLSSYIYSSNLSEKELLQCHLDQIRGFDFRGIKGATIKFNYEDPMDLNIREFSLLRLYSPVFESESLGVELHLGAKGFRKSLNDAFSNLLKILNLFDLYEKSLCSETAVELHTHVHVDRIEFMLRHLEEAEKSDLFKMMKEFGLEGFFKNIIDKVIKDLNLKRALRRSFFTSIYTANYNN